MLFGIIIIIIFLGLTILIFCYSIKKEEKESQELLNDEIKNHYFLKTILNITKKIKGLDEVNKIKLFLKEEDEKNKPVPLFRESIQDVITMSDIGIILGPLGMLLTKKEQEKSIIINKTEDIQGLWSSYLIIKIKGSSLSKKEKNKIYDDIFKKINYLLNVNILLATNQSNIKGAWMVILKDKVLTGRVLNQVFGEVRRTLFKIK